MTIVNQELVQDVIIALLSLAGFAYTFTFKRPSAYRLEGSVTGAAWPQVLLAGMFILSLILVAGQLLARRGAPTRGVARREEESAEFRARKRTAYKRFYLMLAALMAYAVLASVLGFLLATFLVQVAVLWVLSARSGRVMFGVPLLLTTVIYILFIRLLNMPLPRGVGPFLAFSRLFY